MGGWRAEWPHRAGGEEMGAWHCSALSREGWGAERNRRRGPWPGADLRRPQSVELPLWAVTQIQPVKQQVNEVHTSLSSVLSDKSLCYISQTHLFVGFWLLHAFCLYKSSKTLCFWGSQWAFLKVGCATLQRNQTFCPLPDVVCWLKDGIFTKTTSANASVDVHCFSD